MSQKRRAHSADLKAKVAAELKCSNLSKEGINMKKIFIFVILILGNEYCYSQWQECNNGISEKTINCFAAIGNYIFVGTFDGFFLSTDNGENWVRKNNGLTRSHIFSLATKGNNIYAGTYDGVFVSTNYGSDWFPKNYNMQYDYVTSLLIEGNNIFAGTTGGVYLSVDK